MAIWNMIARLTMDSTAFDRNAKTSAHSLKGIQAQSLSLQKGLVDLAGAYLGARGLVAATKSLTAAGIDAESADRGMIAALQIRGQYSEQNAEMLRRQAEGMEDLTVYSRNAIKEQQALALTMGASVPELDAMTEAAVGLAAAYKKDLSQTMRTVALARQGETGQLKEMGIIVDRTKSKQQQFHQVMAIGRVNFDKARADTETLGGAIAQLGNEWEQTKESMAKPLVPALTSAMRFIRQELNGGQGGQATWHQIESLTNQQQASLWQAYEQRLQEQAQARMGNGYTATRNDWREDPAYLAKLAAAYERSVQVQDKIKGGDGAAAAAGATAAQREQIVRLNEQIKEQIAIQREANAGNLQAAETVRYLAAAEEAYGKGTQEAEGAMVKYNSAMEVLNELRSRAAVTQYLEGMRQENEYLAALAAGEDKQAERIKTINELKQQGIDLNDEEKSQLQDMQDAHDRLTGQIEQQSKIQQAAMEKVRDAARGIGNAIAGAVVYGEDLNDNFERMAQQIAYQWISQSIASGGEQAGAAAVNWASKALASAKGNAFAGGRLVAFGEGGILDSPTFFSFGNRQVGVAGEAGTEGIFPLRRDASGKLGVSGSAPQVNVTVVNNGSAKSAKSGPVKWDGRQYVASVILDDLEHNGPISRRMGVR